jgi:signal transduction histidine kinase
LLWGKMPFVAVALGAAFFLYLAFVFPERIPARSIPHPVIFLFPGIAFALLSFTPLILKDVRLEKWGYNSVHGPLHGPFIFYILAYVVVGIAFLFAKFHRISSPIGKLQLKYVLIGLTASPLISLMTNGILPLFWSAKLTYIGPASFIIFVGSTSYAIVKHRLMDIEFIIRKSSVFLLFTIILCFPLFILIVFLENLFHRSINYEFAFLISVLVVLFSIINLRIRATVEAKIEKLIFRGGHNPSRTLMDFGKALVRILDLNSLAGKVIEALLGTLDVVSGSLYILEEEKTSFESYNQRGLVEGKDTVTRIPQNDSLFQWLSEARTVAVREELDLMSPRPGLDRVLIRMKEMQSEICIPLTSRDRIIGIINLGRKRNKKPYTIQDIELLTTLANQTAIAIENAKLYEDLKRQKAVMRRADRLASLGTMTAGLAHEIRNPLVAIKTLTQLLPERIDDEEFRSDFLKIASGEVDRISSLVNELLEFARPTQPQLKPESIEEIMDGMILLISTETKKKSLEVMTSYQDHLPLIPVDREQIKQVFLNVLLNAVEATDEGGRVGVEIRTFSRENKEAFLQIEIRDTGRGIPEEHLDNVFTPFFTTKDKGSGLGCQFPTRLSESTEARSAWKAGPVKDRHFSSIFPYCNLRNQCPWTESTGRTNHFIRFRCDGFNGEKDLTDR